MLLPLQSRRIGETSPKLQNSSKTKSVSRLSGRSFFSVAIRAVVNGPGESFVKALAKWSMSPLVELNLLGLFDIISERQIHFVAERMTEHNLVNFIVARDAPPI